MNTELSEIMSTNNRVVELATKVAYNVDLTNEDKEIAAVIDAWAKELGKTGCDPTHELSQMITKAITPESVLTPSSLIDFMFDSSSIGEFDDISEEVDPTNTIKVYEAIAGGNVDRSFIDSTFLTPTWKTLQAETDISLGQLRRGGFKTVANLINFINEALEQKKIQSIFTTVDGAITFGAANYVNEGSSAPTEPNAKALALYLADVGNGGTPVVFGLNKYIQTLAGLTGATTYLTDAVRNQYNTTGFVKNYAGCELIGLSGVKKLPDDSFIVPDKRLFGVAGKIGDCVTRGDTIVLQSTDINSEKIHIKVGGYQFGTIIRDLTKAAKMVIA